MAVVENTSESSSSNSCSNGTTKAESMVHQKEPSPYETDYVPKVRKPYTIIKQREKWTEEEHQKFLEALQLYGRGWRQIEEHIGTKTAVQIRSHAQKFFSKVSRDGTGSAEISTNPIDIPPPRPKRKPENPYPRKAVFSIAKEESLSPNITKEIENQSPATVLCDVGSDASDSQGSEQYSSSVSPSSCTTDSNSPLPEEINLTAEPSRTIKLFGKTLSVPDNEKHSVFRAPLLKDGIATSNVYMPWLAMYNGFTYPYFPFYSHPAMNFLKEGMTEENRKDQVYLTGSNTQPVGENESETKYFEVKPFNIGNSKRAKGFVPYKRNIAKTTEGESERDYDFLYATS